MLQGVHTSSSFLCVLAPPSPKWPPPSSLTVPLPPPCPLLPTRWADKQRHEAQAQLEVGLAARTEQWKARLWARKLEQYKVLGLGSTMCGMEYE